MYAAKICCQSKLALLEKTCACISKHVSQKPSPIYSVLKSLPVMKFFDNIDILALYHSVHIVKKQKN